MKVSNWFSIFKEKYLRNRVKQHTISIYTTLFRLHIGPVFGERELTEITKTEIQDFLNQLSYEDRLSASSVRLVYVIFNSLLSKAEEEGMIQVNPCRKVRRPQGENTKVQVFTKSQQEKIVSSVYSDEDKRLFGLVICLYTGLRIGELLALKWEDIDFSENMIHVNRTVYGECDGGYHLVFDSPKTDTSDRFIPFSGQLRKILQALKKIPSDYVISMNGKCIGPRTYEAMYHAFLRRHGLPDFKFHVLRHTFATRALEAGVDIKTLSELLGHQSPEITLRIYSHTLMDTKIKAMKMIEKANKLDI